MAAPAHRPNFLLIWIGILILTMVSALRIVIPKAPTRADGFGSDLQPTHLAPSAQPIPVSNTLPLGGLNDSLIPVPAGDSLLAEMDPLNPILLPGGEAASVPGVGSAHGFAQLGGRSSKDGACEANPGQKDGMREVHPQIGPMPDPLQTVRPDLLVSAFERADAAPEILPAPTFVMGFSGFSGTNAAQSAARSEAGQLPDQILIIRLSPEEYRAFLLFAEQGPGATNVPEAVAQSDLSGDEAEASELEDPASGSGAAGNGGSARSWARFAAGWAESHRPPRPPSPEEMRRVAQVLHHVATEESAPRQQISVLDLNPREAARLVTDLLRLAASR
jgi:hypothetical protein